MDNDPFKDKIEFADGSIAKPDLEHLFELSDAYASMYGMGSNASLSDFIKMINEEDPEVLHGMMSAAAKRYERMYGSGKSEKSSKMERAISERTGERPKSSPKLKYDSNVNPVSNRKAFTAFLREWGATDEEIKEANRKIESGEITPSTEDFSWITPDMLARKDFDLKGTLAKMKEARENSVNINISLDKRMARDKK